MIRIELLFETCSKIIIYHLDFLFNFLSKLNTYKKRVLNRPYSMTNIHLNGFYWEFNSRSCLFSFLYYLKGKEYSFPLEK